MVFKIPSSFREEEYITVAPMKRFINDNSIGKNLIARNDCLEAIERFASHSTENEVIVKKWLDVILRAGIKDVFMTYFEPLPTSSLNTSDKSRFEALLAALAPQKTYLCDGKFSSIFSLTTYAVVDTEYGTKIALTFSRKLVQYNLVYSVGTVLTYPVFVDIFVEKKLMCIRCKSKPNLYDASHANIDPASTDTLTIKKIVQTVNDMVFERLALQTATKDYIETLFKQKLYCVLNKYTFTPKVIQDMLDDGKDFLEQTALQLLERFKVVPTHAQKDAVDDLTNMAEKYISINYPDSNIFIEDRAAYPLKLKATDEEESSVEQTSAHDQPLQSKAIFFDNKKMLQKAQACEGITFMFDRSNSKYFPKPKFSVSMSVKNGCCNVKFPMFTDEEDIENVLFQIINADE